MIPIKNKSKIHCIQYFPAIKLEDGGVIRFILDICLLLSRQGVKVTLLTQDDADVPNEWHNDDSLPNVCLLERSTCSLSGWLSKKALRKIERLFDNNAVLHLHVPWLVSNLQVSKVADRCKVPFIITPHGSLDDWSMEQKRLKKMLYWKLFANNMFANSAYIHYTASGEHEQAKKYINKDEVKVIPCIFDLSNYQELPDKNIALRKFQEISNVKFNVLFLSRLHPKKGVDILINATRILIEKGININVLIAGPGDDSVKGYADSLVASVDTKELKESIHFIGMVKGAEKLSLYRCVDLFVLPTHQENFGLVLVESMACATPVLTSFGVDIWKEIKSGGAVIVDNSPRQVADNIELLMSDANKLMEVSEKSREWVLDYLDPEKIANAYIEMYAEALQYNYRNE